MKYLLLVLSTLLFADARDMCQYLRCAACESLTKSMWDRLVDLDGRGKSFQVSHRLGKTGKGVATRDYRTSELRGVEAVENICDTLRGFSLLQESKSSESPWRRYFSKESWPRATTYGKADKAFVKEADKHLMWWCSSSVSEHEEAIIEVVRETSTAASVTDAAHSTVAAFTDAVCNTTMSLCSGEAFESAKSKLQARWADHDKRQEKKRKEAEKKKAEEAERKKTEAGEGVGGEEAAGGAAADDVLGGEGGVEGVEGADVGEGEGVVEGAVGDGAEL